MADIKLVFDADTAPVDRAIRLLDNLEAEIRDVERAEKAGLITKKRATAETARLNTQITRLNTAAKGSAKDFRVFEKSIYGSGKALRQKEIAMQQAGYQLQDFIVQVQAGTNPLIAFSQQGSQLAGFFAGPWGAAIGLGIAALGGLGTALLGTRSKAKSLEETVEGLADAFDAYVETMEESALDQVNGKFQTQTDLLVAIQRELNEIARIKAMEALDKATVELNQEMDGFWGRLSNIKTFLEKKGWFAELDKGVAQFNGNLLHMINNANDLDSRLQSALDIKQMLLDNVGPYNQMTDAQRAFYDMLVKVIQRMEQARGLTEQGGTGAAALDPFGGEGEDNSLIQERNKIIKEENQLRRDLYKKSMQEAVRINNNRYKREQDEINKVESVRQARYTVSLQNATKQSDAARQLADDREAVSIALQAAYRKRTADTQQAAADNYHNGMIARQQAYYDRERKLAKEAFDNALTVLNVAHTPSMIATLAKYAGRGTVDDSDPIYGESGKSIYDKDKGKKLTTIEDTIKAFRRQIETEKTLMTLTGQRRREEELFLDLKYANQDADIKTSETRLRGLAQEMAAMEERSRLIEEARQQQEDIADMIGSSFENAMMSIVDGTKSVEDAFKTMAAEVIKELYRVLVVQQMVNAAKSYFGFADGGVISKGNVVPYANGGVVGSPTYFPMAGGRTGLMGEAGPEAIMPLKRGKNGKLGVQVDGGQQQSVVVNQSFNFQANGDDSVKRIIAQQAPKIAQMTQQQIMDSRRRGGQMKAVFG